jgi:hypothetical protein
MSRTPLETYSDVLEFLLRVENAQDVRITQMAKDAILSAYQELPLVRRWKYFYTRGHLVMDAAYDTGTVAYDDTGGANERQLTLSSGTWPTNAARGQVLIDGKEYKVESRVSSTVVTLSVNNNPGEDIAAGTAYKWWRDTYPMPLDFLSADSFIDHEESWEPLHGSPGSVLNRRSGNQVANRPMSRSFISDPDYVGVMAVRFDPPPDDTYRYDFMYVRCPMPMRVLDYSTGTVAVTSTAVTGTGTSWNSDMVGSLIRFPHSGVNQVPTGNSGLYPYAEQRIVTAVASATSLTIDSVLDGTYSGVKYRISDFIDIDYNTMREAFRKLCEYRFAENLSRQDQGTRYRSFEISLTRAKEADGKRDFSNICPGPVRHWHWQDDRPSGSDVD